jgi:hypothetical protein
MRSGTLVRSPKGLFLSEGHGNGPLSVKFDQETKFMNQSGRYFAVTLVMTLTWAKLL